MYIEKDSHNKSQGWIEVVCGSMFSGKTEELIRRLKRAKIAKLKVEIFKPGVDTRYSEEDVDLALALKYQNRIREAYELFWKATWNKAWADAGYYQAACISMAEGRYDDALDELERCLISNSHNHQARALKA